MGIVRVRQRLRREVALIRLRVLPDVLSPIRPAQAIERVVLVLRARRDDRVVEDHGLLGLIADLHDVADRVVGVAQVLQPS